MGPREVDTLQPTFLIQKWSIKSVTCLWASRYFNSKTRISDADVYDQYELALF